MRIAPAGLTAGLQWRILERMAILKGILAAFGWGDDAGGDGAGGERDLSTPAKRLVGHWRTGFGDIYYKPAKGDATAGAVTIMNDGDPRVNATYKVLEQAPHDRRVTVETTIISSRTGKAHASTTYHFVAKDGMTQYVSMDELHADSNGDNITSGKAVYVNRKTTP